MGNKKQERYLYLDILRVLASFGVVIMPGIFHDYRNYTAELPGALYHKRLSKKESTADISPISYLVRYLSGLEDVSGRSCIGIAHAGNSYAGDE